MVCYFNEIKQEVAHSYIGYAASAETSDSLKAAHENLDFTH